MPRKKKKRVYTQEEKQAVVVEYSVTGNMAKTAKTLGFDRNIIKVWPKQAWWDEMVEANRESVNIRVESNLNKILELAQHRVVSSLTEGDEKLVWDKAKQEHVIKKVLPTGKESAVMMGIGFDKGRLLRNQPTAIRADSDNMNKLKEEFIALSQSYKEKRISSIKGESEEVE